MLKPLARFLAYNNAVPLLLGVVFLGATGALAATSEGRDAVFSQVKQTVSIDNSRIVNVDLAAYPFTIGVTGVREDAEDYYVDYSFHTIDLIEGVWQDVTQAKTLVVAKDALKGGDLGLYTTKQIAEIRAAEKQRLLETQAVERSLGVSQKVVATEYSGLVGRFLDPTTETLPGYVPVVTPPDPEIKVAAMGPAVTSQPQPPEMPPSGGASSEVSGSVAAVTTHVSGDASDTVPPSITVLGNNPARIAVGDSYADLGALVTDNETLNIGYQIFLDDKKVVDVSIDTREPGVHTVRYATADQAGNTAEVSRTVEVYDPHASSPEATTTAAAQ